MIVLSIILICISGIAKSICDTSESTFKNSKLKSLSPFFWNKHTSSSNKWKNGNPSDGEKFIGSSTIFVFLTDAWHLFDLINIVMIFCSISLSYSVIFTGVLFVIRQISFEISYRFLNN